MIASRLPSIEGAAFHTSNGNKIQNNRKSINNRDLSKLFYECCKKTRHIKETCFELNGYPEWWDKGKKSSKPKAANNSQCIELVKGNTTPINGLTTKQYAQLISMLNLEKAYNPTANFTGKAALLSNCIIEWILDSGASDHMTCHASVIDSSKVIPHFSPITIPDGSSIPAKSYGNVFLNPSITLHNVLYIPSFKYVGLPCLFPFFAMISFFVYVCFLTQIKF